jgi:hypothetical protein
MNVPGNAWKGIYAAHAPQTPYQSTKLHGQYVSQYGVMPGIVEGPAVIWRYLRGPPTSARVCSNELYNVQMVTAAGFSALSAPPRQYGINFKIHY